MSLILLAGLFGVAADYSRIQLMRVRALQFLQTLSVENNSLVTDKGNLESHIEVLKDGARKVAVYEMQLKQQVEELKSILDHASTLGVLDDEPIEDLMVDTIDRGVGGPEPVCLKGIDGGCIEEGSLLEGARAMFSFGRYDEGQKGTPGVELIRVIERATSLLKGLPLGNPAHGHLSSRFGMRISPFSRKLRMHEGIDFSLPHGSAVHTTADGVVSFVGRKGAYGSLIEVRHSNGVSTRYAHLSKTLVKKGERVCQGERIGLVGSTGRSTGPHLHYEVRIGDKAVDPLGMLRLGSRLKKALGA